ncbi:pseudouridine synthase [Candidatus Avoscillospira sp. LCP25S3_F1]|uniref:pseudouridine synthase n=1 Tax=Candidatus Avoscillospira sp. LCP25S3_F1 TaxID=3438825 RepID=UPI003F91ADCB
MQRLDKVLSEAGVASRRELKGIIRAGRVTVNGQAARTPEQKVDAAADTILVDGQPITRPGVVVLMLHKPAGYVTSTEDPRDPTVMELIPEPYRAMGLSPVGRLDKETEGLLLLTNDGALLHRLISPKHRVSKVYEAEHDGESTVADVEAFQQGIVLRDGDICLPAELTPLGPGKSRIVLHEGKYHQVRRMMASRGLYVRYLKRVAEGPLELGNLPKGGCRVLKEEEILQL